MPTAFVLGAGLGTRLRPLTDRMPKPLVPMAHVPLITWAFRHLAAGLSIDRFIVNTHHLPHAYAEAFPDGSFGGMPVIFRHESALLDTGGGLANVRDLLPSSEDIAIYNGDILCDAPLAPLAEAHRQSGASVTLLLRSGGSLRNVVCLPDSHTSTGHATGPIRDIRGLLGAAGPAFQFAGICIASPGFIASLPPADKPFSMILAFVDVLKAGGHLAGVVIDDGLWSDLGTPESLLAAHVGLPDGMFPRYAPIAIPRVHPDASVAPGTLDELSWAGPHCVVPPGCRITRSLLLPGARVEPGTTADSRIFFP